MNNEIWKCIANLGWNTYLALLESAGNSLNIILKDADQEKEIVLKFENVLCYRYADEGRRGQTIFEIGKTNVFKEGTFFSVENSKYIAWLADSTNSADDLKQAKHYVYFDSDTCIDVVTLKEFDFKNACQGNEKREEL